MLIPRGAYSEIQNIKVGGESKEIKTYDYICPKEKLPSQFEGISLRQIYNIKTQECFSVISIKYKNNLEEVALTKIEVVAGFPSKNEMLKKIPIDKVVFKKGPQNDINFQYSLSQESFETSMIVFHFTVEEKGKTGEIKQTIFFKELKEGKLIL